MLCLVSGLLGSGAARAQTVTYFDTGEEFAGPFPSWKNVQTDFGAKGDGVTDDTAAIQRALNAMATVLTNDWCVLYFPAGTYRLTATLTTTPLRKAHNDYLGSNLIGADPATTVLKWDGPADQPMLRYDSWFCKVSRLTFDGSGKANSGLLRAGGFSTYCEISDLVFQDIKGIALNLANAEPEGAAEHAVLRCKFLRCTEGISTINWNTLDIYIWYCLFEDCDAGVTNRTGGYQAYENVFLRTKTQDMTTGSACTALVNNTSIGSKTFLFGGWGALYARGNKLYTTDSVALTHGGNLVLLDNLIAGPPGGTGALVSCATSTLAVGNSFTGGAWPIRPLPALHPNAGTLQQELGKAVDNDPTTEFYDPGCNDPYSGNPGFPGALQWNGRSDNRRTAVQYTLTSGSDPQFDPRDFQLLGSNYPGGPWTVLDTQTNQSWAGRQETKAYPLAAPQACSVYKLLVTANATGTRGLRVAELQLLDKQGRNLTQDPDTLMTSRNEAWGSYYALDRKVIASAAAAAPATVRLPGTPKNAQRKIFEVRLGTGDDARELQTQIDAAAQEPAGSKPVVHLPKGTFSLQRTVTIPAGSDLQLIGDGVGNGSLLTFAGGEGPMLRLLGPSRATLRDLDIFGGNQGGVDGIVITDADQEGGRVYGNQLNTHGAGNPNLCQSAVRVQGLDRTDVTMICGGFGHCRNGINVSGGPQAAAGVATTNQVVFLTGGTGLGCRLLNVSDGGKVVGEAFWYEGPWESDAALIDLQGTTGQVAGAALWWHTDLKRQPLPAPLMAMNGFQGQCTVVASDLDDLNNSYVHLNGDGRQASVFFADNLFSSSSRTPTIQDPWKDLTTPAAQAVMLGCNNDTMVNKERNRMPDADFVRRSLALLRAVRIDLPTDLPRGVTDVKLFRVQITGGNDKDAIRIQAGK
jgi:hypothetical protein